MALEDFRQMTIPQLKDEIVKQRKVLLKLRFQRVNGQLDNYGGFKRVKKNIARAYTVIREKQLKDVKKVKE